MKKYGGKNSRKYRENTNLTPPPTIRKSNLK
jgi:hypothetical protein